jgi:hypothetical protein
MTDEKVRENRLRRIAERQGYVLKKSRARQWNVNDLQGYMIVDAQYNVVAAGSRFELSLDDVEQFLTEGEQERKEKIK